MKVEQSYDHFGEKEKVFMEQAIEEAKNGLLVKQREEPYIPTDKMSNFISCFGSEPTKGVLVDNCMIVDFTDTLQSRYDPRTLQVTFPQALDNMLGDRKNLSWELWKSNSIQTCRINY